MKKSILIIAWITGYSCGLKAQDNSQVLLNFDGQDKASIIYWEGTLESNVDNPDTTGKNTSETVAQYGRLDILEPVVVITTQGMMRANSYASHGPAAPKFKMLVYTEEAPVGSKIQLLVGDITINTYPEGFHSVYESQTTVQYEWEELEFQFVQLVPGGMTDTTNLNKISLMFAPQTTTVDVYYFDSIVGPEFDDFTSVQILAYKKIGLKQNFPNPAKNTTIIKYAVKESGHVKLSLYNMVGQEITSIANGFHTVGDYNVVFNTEGLTEGVYFYTLSIGDFRQTKKLTVLK
ncbi:MAG: T9SS type A sorting domain-containing protein [Bacteroidetes bacterium]|nr:T9SS type A sorting domain-containing protein [Bacteroidota bacterium]